MNATDDDPMIEAPVKTAIDDFLSVSTKKVSNLYQRQRPVSKKHSSDRNSTNSSRRDFSVAPSTESNSSMRSNGSKPQNMDRQVPSALGIKHIVSPLPMSASASMKPKINRKTLNKLKRKRIEENTTHYQVNISFSSKIISCTAQPLSSQGRRVVNYLIIGTLFAKEIISLDPTSHMRWPLTNDCAEMESRRQSLHNNLKKEGEMVSFPRDFIGTLNGSEKHNPSFILSADDDNSKASMSIQSLACMAKAMNAGIVFTSSNDYHFFMMPHAVSGSLACVWDNVIQMQELRMDHSSSAAGTELQHVDNCTEVLLKKSKMSSPCKEDDIAATTQDFENNDEDVQDLSPDSEFEPLEWDDLLLQYTSCIAQEEGAPLPFEFAQKNFCAAIATLRNRYQDQHAKELFDLLRLPLGDNEQSFHLLQTQSELSTTLKARPREGSNVDNRNDPSQGEARTHTKQNEFVQLILVQILMRIQLFAMYNGDDAERSTFLQEFSLLDPRNSLVKKSKKERKKQKPYTVQNFTSELYSLAEKLSFILPSPGSFAGFFNEQVLIPFRSIVPELIADISSFFELDISDSEDVIESHLAEDNGENANSSVDDICASSPITESKSRWSQSTLPTQIKTEEVELPPSAEEDVILPEPEDKVLFKNKVDLTVHRNMTNPLLAGSKGRYIGRQFSGNYFREVKVTKSVPAAKKKPPTHYVEIPEKPSPRSLSATVSETPEAKPRRTMSLGMASLGASNISFRTKAAPKRSNANKLGTATKPNSNKDMPPPKGKNSHSAVMAALAAMRKKR